MKKMVLIASLIILSIYFDGGELSGQERTKVLFDEYHASWKTSKHLPDITQELENRGYSVSFFGEELDSDLLSTYDVLVLFIPFRYFDEYEREAIRRFVEDGGGLIIFGEHGGYMEYKRISSAVNSISTIFGIEFNVDVVEDLERNREGVGCHPIITNFRRHPVTEGVDSIGYICGCSLSIRSSATALAFGNSTTTADGHKGNDVIVLAVVEYGKGKVVTIGDTDFLVGSNSSGYDEDFFSFRDNKKLALNMFEWVSPIDLAEADNLASSGYALYSQEEYTQAKSLFRNALKIYSSAKAMEKITEMEEMIDTCAKAIAAETAYEKGEQYYEENEYDGATEEFQKSKSLFDEIGNSSRSEIVQLMIDTCAKAIAAETAYEKGEQYYEENEYEEAITKFEEAFRLYKELENFRRIEETISRIQETKDAIKERDEHVARIRSLALLLSAGVLIGTAIFSSVKLFFRSHQARKELPPAGTGYCAVCGKLNEREAYFCRYCGAQLKSLDELEIEEALATLRSKLADKEITEEEYHEIKRELEGSS